MTSPAFKAGARIPKKYTCQGEDVSPPLVVTNIPQGAKSLVLIVDDPDAPMKTWTHWVVYDIPAPQGNELVIKESEVPGRQSANDFRKLDYGGPCPPSGTHRYFFRVYALRIGSLPVSLNINRNVVEMGMEGQVITQAELIGLYKKE